MQCKVGTQVITLTDKDLKGSGGEGSVYIKGSKAYKIYFDQARVLPLGKIQELGAIRHSRVLRPLEAMYDKAGALIGYAMEATPPDTYVLCQYFPTAFRSRMGLDNAFSNALVEDLRSGVQHVHNAQVLIVDLNEMNFLFATAQPLVYFIDVDSYQTPHFQATALMESVRDRHVRTVVKNGNCVPVFDQGSDWFSFAVVSFQIFTGIHPYKGKHPTLKTMDERMVANVSVLSSDVRVPGAALPFSVIPPVYLDWYKRVFEKGERSAPPASTGGSVVMVKTVALAGGGRIRVFNVIDMQEQIADYYDGAVVAGGNVYSSHGRIVLPNVLGEVRLAASADGPVAAFVKDGLLHVADAETGETVADMTCDAMAVCDNRLVFKSGEYLYSAELLRAGKNLFVKRQQVANVLPMGTQLFDGVAMQDLLGAQYATLVTNSGTHQVQLPELKQHRIVSAKRERNVLVVIAEHNGQLNRHVYRFDTDWQHFDYRVANDVGPSEANFCVLDSGIVLLMREDDMLEVFSSHRGSQSVNTVDDPAVDSSCRLRAHGSKAMYIRGTRVDHFTMT
ncbi:MAG: hypothetical protein JSS66_05435 [Armatimonadetes bacterium]|nr:hypothetical protein [Armatimonadota bacterium]